MPAHFDVLESRRLFAGGTEVPTFRAGGASGDQRIPDNGSTVTFQGRKGESVTAQEVLTDSGGRVYAVAHTNNTVQVIRTGRDGAIDTAFGDGKGVVVAKADAAFFTKLSAGGTDVALDPADRLYVLSGQTITRYTAAGKLDGTFGKGGSFTLKGLAGARQIAIDADNKIWVAGSIQNGKKENGLQFVVARLRSKGQYDPTFDSDGIFAVAKPASGGRTQGDYVRVLADHSVVVAGAVGAVAADNVNIIAEQTQGFQSVHFRRDGELDTGYGTGGVYGLTAAASVDGLRFIAPVALRGDGTVAYLRTSTFGDADGGYYFLNATAHGSALSAFGGSQAAQVSLEDANFFTVRGTEFLAAGTNQVFRLTADGTDFDTTFLPDSGNTLFPVLVAGPDDSDGTVVGLTVARNPLRLNVNRYFADGRPIAQLSAKTLKTAATSLTFSVDYSAQVGIKSGIVNGDELRLVAPDGTALHTRLVSTTTNNIGVVTAKYRAVDANGQGWDKADNGVYAVRWLAGTVTDSVDTANLRQTIGSVTVAIA